MTQKILRKITLFFSQIFIYIDFILKSTRDIIIYGDRKKKTDAEFIDKFWAYKGAKGHYKVKFHNLILGTPWLPMLRVQLRSFFVKQEYRFPVEANGIIVDLGANIGIASLYFLLELKPKKLISVEADPIIFEKYLKPNVKQTNFNDVEFINKAVWNESNKQITFNATGVDSGAVSDNGNTSVETISLDDILKDYESIELLKVDIEGAESTVLMQSNLLNRVKNIYVEVEVGNPPDKDYLSLIKYLENLKFKIFLRSDLVHSSPQKTFESDGIVQYVHIIGSRF